jgi:hypothetical protein
MWTPWLMVTRLLKTHLYGTLFSPFEEQMDGESSVALLAAYRDPGALITRYRIVGTVETLILFAWTFSIAKTHQFIMNEECNASTQSWCASECQYSVEIGVSDLPATADPL